MLKSYALSVCLVLLYLGGGILFFSGGLKIGFENGLCCFGFMISKRFLHLYFTVFPLLFALFICVFISYLLPFRLLNWREKFRARSCRLPGGHMVITCTINPKEQKKLIFHQCCHVSALCTTCLRRNIQVGAPMFSRFNRIG